MKKIIIITIGLAFLTSCRVADLTIVSTRNVDPEAKHELVKQSAKGVAFDIESAIDKALKDSGGDYMTNVVIKSGIFLYYVNGDAYKKK